MRSELRFGVDVDRLASHMNCIYRRLYLTDKVIADVAIHHGGFDVIVPGYALNEVYIGTLLYHVGEGAMPDEMGVNAFRNTGFCSELFHYLVYTCFRILIGKLST